MPADYWISPDEERRILDAGARRRAQAAAYSRQINEDTAARATELLSRNPNLSAGLLQSLLLGNVPDEEADALAAEDDGGILGSIFDVAGDVIEHVTDGVEYAADKAWEYGIKPAIRTVFTAADTLAQELVQRPLTSAVATATGDAGSFGEAYDAYGDSAGKNFLEGQSDLGTGFFAEGADERTLTINDRYADVGQAVAASTAGLFVDPGTKAYDITALVGGFAVEVFGDPLALATMGASKAVTAARHIDPKMAQKLLAEAGMVSGRRATVIPEKARNLFGNEKVLERLAAADAYTIHQVWSAAPTHRVDLDVIGRLGAASTKDEVLEVLLESAASGDITQKGFYSGMGRFVKQNLAESTSKFAGPFRYLTSEGKFAGLAPTGMLSADDMGTAAGKVDSFLRQANVDREVRSGIFNRFAAAPSGSFDELFDITTDAMDAVARSVGDDVSLNDVAKAFRNEIDAFRSYAIAADGSELANPLAKPKIIQNFDGEEFEVMLPTPAMTSQLNSLALTLPDISDVRRAATSNRVMRAVYQSKGWDATEASTRFITKKLFKPLAILRPAYIVRIGAEEQARLAVTGYDSLFSHPARWIAANIRNRGELQDLVGDNLLDTARATGVVTKDAYGILADNGSRARLFDQTAAVDSTGSLTKQGGRGWRMELGQVSSAPEMRKLAELRGDTAAFKEWAQGDGRKHIERMAKVNADSNKLLEFGDQFDDWADNVLRPTLERVTGGWDDELLERIVAGDIPMAGDASEKAAAFTNFLTRKASEGKAPAKVRVQAPDEGGVHRMKTFVDGLFDHITGKPTSYLARYPAFRQSIIKRTGELMDSVADDAMRADVLERAVKNLGVKEGTPEFKALQDAMARSKGARGPIDNIDDLNDIVISKSAQDVKDLLFDVTNRSAAQESFEAVVPFLDAWKEVTMTWSRLAKANPAFFIRAQAGYRELEDNGMFYVNDQGEEVFAYPGGGAFTAFVRRMNEAGGDLLDVVPAAAGAVADAVTGNTPDYSTKIEGRIEGLNLVAQGVGPGFGPVVQWAAGVMPRAPELDDLRKFLAPFGTNLDAPASAADPATYAKALMPAWFDKLSNAVTGGTVDERQWNSTVGDAMKALAVSGDYDPSDQKRLLEDAERYGRLMLLMRSAIQFAGPTGPSATVQVELDSTQPYLEEWNSEIDPEGKMFGVNVLAADYYRLMSTYGPEMAAEKFYDLYGAEPFFLAQAKTRSLKELPVTTEGDRWMRKNEGLIDDYAAVVGLFAPTSEDAELDFSVYAAQIARGDRQSLSPQEQVQLATQVRARTMYQAVKDKVAHLPKAQRDRIEEMAKARLETLHPGWQAQVIGVAGSARLSDKIGQLQRAVEDERLADNPAIPALRAYLTVREGVMAQARARGLKTLSSDKVADLRALLNQAGTFLQAKHTAFIPLWSEVLSREVGD